MATYAELMTAIIKKQISIIGEKIALQLARKVFGLKVSDDGTVTAGASKEALADLLEQYKAIAGGVAVMFAKRAIEPILSGKEDLPEELK